MDITPTRFILGKFEDSPLEESELFNSSLVLSCVDEESFYLINASQFNNVNRLDLPMDGFV